MMEDVMLQLFLSFAKVSDGFKRLVFGLLIAFLKEAAIILDVSFEQVIGLRFSGLINYSKISDSFEEFLRILMHILHESCFGLSDVTVIFCLMVTLFYYKSKSVKQFAQIRTLYEQKLSELKRELQNQDDVFCHTMAGLKKAEKQSVELNRFMFQQLRSTEKVLIKFNEERNIFKHPAVLAQQPYFGKANGLETKDGNNAKSFSNSKITDGHLQKSHSSSNYPIETETKQIESAL